ncbi:hypothetical protein CA2015_3655 [Cyclobacterium amurskyense]|uniref:Uncharacterized protein n=1 Tax=Cyclobacterium amurskyense TaxID=320787 RepID=A0A0H4PXD0_9BACT|nr:hypothetical protein CA2015_3655 [Cyclobacterium amurskyense]
MVLKTENFIIKFCKKNKIKIHGSFDPSQAGLNESYFYDGMHSKEKAIEKLLKTN